MAKRVTPEQFAIELGDLPERLEGAVIQGARRAAMRLVVDVTQEIDTNKPYPVVDRGTLRQSVQMESTPKGANVFTAAPYAQVQERGSRPFWAPLAPLVAWATRKGHDDPVGFARAVQASIAKNGIRPKWYFKRAVKKWWARGTFKSEIGKALERAKNR